MPTIFETIAPNARMNTKNYKILSPEGEVEFLGVNRISRNQYLSLKFSDGTTLKCSEEHPLMTIDGIVRAKNLTKHEEVQSKSGGCFLTSKRLVKRKIYLYDIVDSGEKHLYYSNGLVSHNCDFVGSVHTLISPRKLKTLTFVNPIYKNDDGFKVYEKSKKDHNYIMMVDTSRGTGNDYHAFTVIDMTTAPYKVVATFRNNILPPAMFPTAIIAAGRQFNDAMVLVELNDIGGQVADIIHDEFEYEGLLNTSVKGRKGQVLDGGFNAQNQQRGVKTTEVVKRVGCTTLKGLIEQEKLIIEDYDLVRELFSFVSKKNSYEAETGHHDDLVMTLVLFAWLTTQLYFKDIMGSNPSFEMYANQMKTLEEEMFFGFIDDGVTDPFDENSEWKIT